MGIFFFIIGHTFGVNKIILRSFTANLFSQFLTVSAKPTDTDNWHEGTVLQEGLWHYHIIIDNL